MRNFLELPGTRTSPRPRVFRPGLEFLEDRLTPAAIVNTDFSVNNPADPQFGWTIAGSGSVVNNQGVLDENSSVLTEFSQGFSFPANATLLRFTLVRSSLQANSANNPPDAFEAALLDGSQSSLVGVAQGLSNTDAFLNSQQTGEVFFGPQVQVPGVSTSGQVANLTFPLIITVDVSGVAAGTQATLFYDLLGFAPATSSVLMDDVQLLEGRQPPLLTAVLDPDSHA